MRVKATTQARWAEEARVYRDYRRANPLKKIRPKRKRPNSRQKKRARYWAMLADSEDAQAEREFWEDESRAWHNRERQEEQEEQDREEEERERDAIEFERERLEEQIEDLYR